MRRVTIIGSGMGGLATGIILAKNGCDVTILEQHALIGGCLQCFKRDGAKFETGMHFIGSADPGQTLRRLFDFLGITDNVRLSRMDTDAYNIIAFGDQRYRIPNGTEAVIDRMAHYFPDSRGDVEQYCKIIDLVATSSSLHTLDEASADLAVCTKYRLLSTDEVIDMAVRNPQLRNVLAGHLPLYAGEKGRTPFSIHAFITDFYNQSAFRIVGGSDHIASAMLRQLERHGGRVLTRKRVTRIDCDGPMATGVATADGDYFETDCVISDIHPARLMDLCDSSLLRPVFRRRMKEIPNTTSCFALYLRFSDGKVPYMNSNYFGYHKSTPWGCENYTAATWPDSYLYMHFCHTDDPQYAESGVIISYMRMDDVAPWADIDKPGQRGAGYEEFKHERAERLLDAVERDFPGLRGCIKSYYTSTPLTQRDYTGAPDGSMYGVARNVKAAEASRVPQRTRIGNLLLTGQNINSHGALGVLVGAIITSAELLTAPVIYRQIIDSERAE